MKYLFFDIECACVFKEVAKICVFGYCLCDEKFNIIEQEDILINPQGHFHLTDRKGKQGLVLPYKYDDFKNYPVYQSVFPKIKSLIEDADTIVIGHATMNDVKYLNLESKRFSLPALKFNFADTQFIYMNTVNDFRRQYGLKETAVSLGLEFDFTEHSAVNDAFATMRIAQELCKKDGVDLTGLLAKYNITMGHTENLEVKQNESLSHLKHVEEVIKNKEKREKAKANFHEFVDKNRKKRNKKGVVFGKKVCFSHRLEEDNEEAKPLILGFYALGGDYTCRIEECNYYVSEEPENNVRMQKAKTSDVKVFSVAEFKDFLSQKSNN